MGKNTKERKLLDVSSDEFLRSRNRQEQQAKDTKDDASRRMLLFYAVECGGKYQIMFKEKCHLFSKLPKKHQGYMHDIQKILMVLGIEAKCPFPPLKSTKDDIITPAHYQEMWRYGINCENAKENGEIIEKSLLVALERLHELEKRK